MRHCLRRDFPRPCNDWNREWDINLASPWLPLTKLWLNAVKAGTGPTTNSCTFHNYQLLKSCQHLKNEWKDWRLSVSQLLFGEVRNQRTEEPLPKLRIGQDKGTSWKNNYKSYSNLKATKNRPAVWRPACSFFIIIFNFSNAQFRLCFIIRYWARLLRLLLAARLADNDLLTCRFSAHSTEVGCTDTIKHFHLVWIVTWSTYKSRVYIQFKMHFSQFVLAVRLHDLAAESWFAVANICLSNFNINFCHAKQKQHKTQLLAIELIELATLELPHLFITVVAYFIL